MWPWEHLAVGYLLLSAATRLFRRRSPTTAEVLAVALGTQFPDLVDKPLAWTFAVLPSGTSLAHSIFVAVPLSLLTWVAGRRLDRGSVGAAFALGYLSHLPADVCYGLVYGRAPTYDAVLWPLVEATPTRRPGLMANFFYYLDRTFRFVAGADGRWYLLAELGALLVVGLVWLLDGAPVVAPFVRRMSR